MIAGALRRFLAAGRCFSPVAAEVAGARACARRSTALAAAGAPPVVLLAGLGLSGRYMLPFGAELSARFPVWVPELPGYGRTEASRQVLGMAALADFVAAWMDAMGLDRVVLVASSAGCQVAVEMAARHADRVRCIVLQAPTMDAHARTVPRHLWRLAVDALREPPSLAALQVADWFGTGVRRLIGTVRLAFAHRIEERLPLVRCPALVVRGARDPIVSQRWAEQVAAGLPLGALVVVPAGTHALTYSAPAVLAGIVERLIARTQP